MEDREETQNSMHHTEDLPFKVIEKPKRHADNYHVDICGFIPMVDVYLRW